MNTQDFKRKLTAVFSADVAGYSRLMGGDEAATVKTLEAYKQIMFSLIRQHRGRVIDSPGDNLLAEFASVVDAVQCAVAVQKELKARNADLPENRKMEFRIGINLGDVIEEQERIYGDGVNIAARLEALAPPGGICVSKTAFDHIESKLPLGYEYLGEQSVKNIAKPVGAYRVVLEPRITVVGAGKKPPLKLRRLALGIAVIVIALAVGLSLWQLVLRPSNPAMEKADPKKMVLPLPDKPSVAVLPFVNMSDDPKQEYLADGITENIISALSQVPKLFVIARNSTFTYKGKPVKVQQVAEELGVRYVLEGSVQRSGDELRVTAQLIDAINGHHVWSERYDREMKKIFALQDDITLKVITALQVRLTEGEQARLSAKGTENLQAYLKSLQAREALFMVTKEGNDKARRLSEEAIALDPQFPTPYGILASTHFMDVSLGASKSPTESLQLALELAKKVQAMDETRPVSIIGWLYILAGRQYDKAIAESEKAITLAPNSADAHSFSAIVLIYAGRPEEAVRHVEQALRLDPIPPGWYYRNLGLAYFHVGRYEDAIATLKKSLSRTPNDLLTHLHLTTTYSWAGRHEEARAQTAEVMRINPKVSVEERAKVLQYKNQADVDRYLEGLRKAGIPEKSPLPIPDKPSIAVLPFVNMSEDKSQEFFSDGLTEEIIGALSKVGNLFVVSRNSSFTYKGKSVDVRQVGREMGVRYVLEGSVRKEANRLRITAQLIDTTTGDHVFSERYDREMKDVFAVQDDITMKITTAMRVNLTHGEQDRMLAKGTKNLEAYLKILESRKYRETFTRESMAKSRQAAEEAIALDPGYAIAYSAAAGAIGNETWLGVYDDPAVPLSRALELAQKGVSLDDSLAFPRIALGFIYLVRKDYDKAIAEAERAVALEPNSTDALTQLGVNLFCGGRAEEAIPILQKAVSLSPVPEYRLVQNLANAYRSVGNFEKAVEINQKILQKQPNQIFPHLQLAATFMLIGKEEEAKHHASEVMRIDPRFSLERYSKTLPWKNRDEVDRVIDAARKAGVK